MTNSVFYSHENNRHVRFWYRCNYILLLAVNLIAFQASAQQEKEFLNLLKNSSKNSRDSIYYELSKACLGKHNTKAKHYADTALSLSTIFNHRTLQIKASRLLGYCSEISSDWNSAFKFYHKGALIARRHNLDRNLIDTYNDIGYLHQQLDVYDSALHYFTLSDILAEKSASPSVQAIIASNIGYVNSYLRNYREALTYYKKAIHIEEQNKTSSLLALNHVNLARIYCDIDSLEEANKEIRLVEKMCLKNCDSVSLAHLRYEKGYFLVRSAKPNDAYSFFENALVIANKVDDKQLASNALYQIASLYADDGLNEKAVEHLLKAKDLAEAISHRRLLIDIYYKLSELYGKLNVANLELRYHKLYSSLENNIFNQSVANNVQSIQLDQQRKKNDVILAGKNSELWKLSNLSVIAVIGFIIALIFSFMIIQDMRVKKMIKKNDIANRMLVSNEMQLREIFRLNLQLDELSTRVTSVLQGPVATLAGLGNVMKNVKTADEYNECVNKLSLSCMKIDAVLKNMKELVLVKNHYVDPEIVNVSDLSTHIHNDFKKIKSFLLLNIDIRKSVIKDLYTDKFLLLALISNAICYFSHLNEVPVVEITFEQSNDSDITIITVKHPAPHSEIIPDENHINHLTAIVIAGRLKGWATVIGHTEYSKIEIKIPTALNLQAESILGIRQTFS